MSKNITVERRDNMITIRLTAEEKNNLIFVSKALNLSYTDLFVYCLNFLQPLTQNVLKSENK